MLLDLMSVVPLITWAFVAIAAIPVYARISWFAPVACAVYTGLVCSIGAVVLWRRTHVLHRKLVYKICLSALFFNYLWSLQFFLR